MQLAMLTSDGSFIIGRGICLSKVADKAYPVLVQCDQSQQQKWHYDKEVSGLNLFSFGHF